MIMLKKSVYDQLKTQNILLSIDVTVNGLRKKRFLFTMAKILTLNNAHGCLKYL